MSVASNDGSDSCDGDGSWCCSDCAIGSGCDGEVC